MPRDANPDDSPGHVCPWWKGYLLDNLLRPLLHPPKTFAPFVRPGSTVYDIGCGMGALTFMLADLVGPSGRVYGVDIQDKMLAPLRRRIAEKGLTGRVFALAVDPDDLFFPVPADFALCFWMVHEVPSRERFFAQLRAGLKPGGCALVAEPPFHVSPDVFEAELDAAQAAGFSVVARPAIRLSRSALLRGNG